jgi:hypothetical protein
MQEEYHSLMRNHTWDWFPCLYEAQIICASGFIGKFCLWNGLVKKHKSWLVAKDSHKYLALTTMRHLHLIAKMESIQLVLTIVANQCWEVHQMDMKSAFLYEDLEEEIYMEQP